MEEDWLDQVRQRLVVDGEVEGDRLAVEDRGQGSPWSCWEEVPLLLDDLVDLDTSPCQQLGGDHADFVPQEVETDVGPVWEQFPGD